MKRRIFKGLFFQSCLIVCLSAVFIVGMLYNYFSDITAKEIKNELVFISAGVEQNGIDYLESISDMDSRLTWISSDGMIIYDSKEDEQTMENHSDRQEFVEALENGNGESYRYSTTLGEMSYYCANLLSDGSVLRISGSRYVADSLFIGALSPVLCVVLISFVVSILVSGKVSTMITQPINEIDLSNLEEVKTYEELEPFIRKILHQNTKIQSQFYELQRKQHEFDTITENMNEGLLLFNKNADIVFYNTSALKILGAADVLEKQSVYALNRSHNFMRAVEKALIGEHCERSIKLNDRTYQIIANPVYDDKHVSGGVVLMLDITEKEEREALRREFSANVSHELKTPLTSISGFAEIMKSGMVKDEDMKRFAGNIYSEAKRMISLVGDIIKLSKFDEGNEIAEFTEVDVATVIRENVLRLRSQAESKNVQIIDNCEMININAHYGVIDEMVYNLIENAIKYNVEGGKVYVSWECKDNKKILTVEDNGIGIPYADQQRVFERFYRVDKSHSKEIGGTGLGLSIVKHGAAMHKANIELESEQGKGTKIKVVF